MIFNPDGLTVSPVSVENHGMGNYALTVSEHGCGLAFQVQAVSPWEPVTEARILETSRFLHEVITSKAPCSVPPEGEWSVDLSRAVLHAFDAAHASRLKESVRSRARRDSAMGRLKIAIREAVNSGVAEDAIEEMVREAVVCNVIES